MNLIRALEVWIDVEELLERFDRPAMQETEKFFVYILLSLCEAAFGCRLSNLHRYLTMC